jgi:hypothetical protein
MRSLFIGLSLAKNIGKTTTGNVCSAKTQRNTSDSTSRAKLARKGLLSPPRDNQVCSTPSRSDAGRVDGETV